MNYKSFADLTRMYKENEANMDKLAKNFSNIIQQSLVPNVQYDKLSKLTISHPHMYRAFWRGDIIGESVMDNPYVRDPNKSIKENAIRSVLNYFKFVSWNGGHEEVDGLSDQELDSVARFMASKEIELYDLILKYQELEYKSLELSSERKNFKNIKKIIVLTYVYGKGKDGEISFQVDKDLKLKLGTVWNRITKIAEHLERKKVSTVDVSGGSNLEEEEICLSLVDQIAETKAEAEKKIQTIKALILAKIPE